MGYSAKIRDQHLSRQLTSGLSIRQYCRRHQFSEPTFYAWRKQADLALTTTRSLESTPPAGFTQLQPMPPLCAVALGDESKPFAGTSAMTFASGLRLEVQHFSIDQLAELILKLEARYA